MHTHPNRSFLKMRHLLTQLAAVTGLALPLPGETPFPGRISKESYSYFEDYMYTKNDDSTVAIAHYRGPGGAVAVAESINGMTVTGIKEGSFRRCRGLAAVSIPKSIAQIDGRAFLGCASLTEITVDAANPKYCSKDGILFNKDMTELICYPGGRKAGAYSIPAGVSRVGPCAFFGLRSLTSVNFPSGFTTIGDSAFYGCGGLTSVSFPNSLTSIGVRGFEGCRRLTSVAIPDRVASIGDMAFDDCVGLTSLTIGKGVTRIGSGAFSGCVGLTSVTIPKGVTSIGNWAFGNCKGLSSVALPDGMSKIEWAAFNNCANLSAITIPASVTSIEDGAFEHCTSLVAITVDDANPNYSSPEGVLFDKNRSQLIQWPLGKKAASYAIPNGVTRIKSNAFRNSKGLGAVSIPSSVTEIPRYAFAACTGLAEISVDAAHPKFSSSNGVLFNKDRTELIQCPGGKAGAYTIPDSVTHVGNLAFNDCADLTSVTIPASVAKMDSPPFESCTKLTAITVDAANPNYSSLDGLLFNKDRTELIQCPGGKAGGCVIPNGVTRIGYRAFDACARLISVTIPNSVTHIGDDAFSSCTGLTSLAIPEGVAAIGENAFRACTALATVTIPKSVTYIQEGAFRLCTGLTAITVDAGNLKYNSRDGVLFDLFRTLIRFPGGKATGAYTIPDGVTSIGNGAFADCKTLTSVTIPGSVKNIGYRAFADCAALKSAVFTGILPEMDSDAFVNTAREFTIQWAQSAPGNAPAAKPEPPRGADANPPSWTSIAGKTIRAKFIRLDGEAVVIEKEGGRQFKVPFKDLKPESVKQAKELAKRRQ
jgi:hypothetical protein